MADRPALTESTLSLGMVDAGVAEMRERTFGEDLGEIVRAVYAAMEAARVSETAKNAPPSA